MLLNVEVEMSKITSEQGREIYELATSTKPKMSNVELGKKYGVSERAIRFHIKKYEKQVHTIAKNNNRLNTALANNKINLVHEATETLKDIKESLTQAKNEGVSPERLSSLYSCRIRSLESISEIVSLEEIEERILKLEGKKKCP